MIPWLLVAELMSKSGLFGTGLKIDLMHFQALVKQTFELMMLMQQLTGLTLIALMRFPLIQQMASV